MNSRTLPYLAAFIAGMIALMLALPGHTAPAVAATADLGNGSYLTITPEKCALPVAIEAWAPILANLRVMGYDLELYASRLMWNGVLLAGCYAIGPDNDGIYNIDSTGQKLMPYVPGEAFEPGDRPARPMPKGGREA